MFKKLVDYIKNSIYELKKVDWPNKQETIRHTLVVIGVSIGVAFFLGIVDLLLTSLLERVI